MKSGATNWISGTDTISKVLDSMNSKFSNAIDAGTKMAGASTALSCMATALATPAYNLDNGVNHRPAVQQWAVCTP